MEIDNMVVSHSIEDSGFVDLIVMMVVGSASILRTLAQVIGFVTS